LVSQLLIFIFRLCLGVALCLATLLKHVFKYRTKRKRKSFADEVEPLRVFLPRLRWTFDRKWAILIRFAGVVIITGTTLMLPLPGGLTSHGYRAIGLLVFTASILALDPVSLPISALMVPLMAVILGVGTATQAFEPFSRPVVFLILASLFLAEVLRKHGLTRRLALASILLSHGNVKRLLLNLMGIAALFSMWVENTATAAVLIPVALSVSRRVSDPDEAKSLLSWLVLGIAYSASLGGMVTIMGSASNAVASGFLAQLRPWSFIDWMYYGLPAFILLFPLTFWFLIRFVPIRVDRVDIEPVKREIQEMGSMKASEREILVTLAVTAFFWITGSFLEPLFRLPSTLLSSAVVALMAVAYLAIRGLINWEDLKGVNWGIYLIIGAGLTLGETLTRNGTTEWFAKMIGPLITQFPLYLSLLLLVFMAALLTNVLNNTTIAAVFVPVLISIGRSEPSLNVLQLVLPVTLATTFGYSLPSASGRMALIAASGIVSRGEMMRYGFWLTCLSAGLLTIFFYVLAVLNLI